MGTIRYSMGISWDFGKLWNLYSEVNTRMNNHVNVKFSLSVISALTFGKEMWCWGAGQVQRDLYMKEGPELSS